MTTSCDRAADQSLAGITANDPAEAVYLVNFTDANGAKLSPQGRYELVSAPVSFRRWTRSGRWPPTPSQDMNLIPNPASRYSVGDRTPGLVQDPDGGLTIYLQPGSPGKEREANWLPTSADHPWFVILRMYLPQPAVIEAKWECPGITPLT